MIFMLLKFLLLEEPTFTQRFMIPMVNHCASHGRVLICVCVVQNFVMYVCNLFVSCFPCSVGGFKEA